jgi:hypothetical protein
MSQPDKFLVLLLRLGGLMTLSAVVPMCFPFAWMDAIHRALSLGELPNVPIVAYLTRSLSAMYAMHGALLLYLSFDVPRYLLAIRFLGLLAVLFGLSLLAIDLAAGLPWPWTAVEGPFVAGIGTAIWYLAGRRLAAAQFDAAPPQR